MGFAKPDQIARRTIKAGCHKIDMPLKSKITLGFAAGAFIAIGFLLAIRVSAVIPAEWGGVGSLVGAALFPLGLILVLIAGGELLTGNMMAVPLACFAGERRLSAWASNWIVITLSNFAGAVFIAYVFGHLGGFTEHGVYLERTIALTASKLEEPFLVAFISGIGCNWLVALAVWISYGADDGAGKILGIWFPTMAFVALGFQHIVANMFLIPAAIFAGHATWGQYLTNFVPVFLGNAVGGAIFVAGIYRLAYASKKETKEAVESKSAEQAGEVSSIQASVH